MSRQITSSAPIPCHMCGEQETRFYTTQRPDYDGYGSLVCRYCYDEYKQVEEFQNSN